MSGAPRRLSGPPLAEPAEEVNVSLRLSRWAAETPGRCAVRAADGRSLTFAELEEKSQRIAAGMVALGLRPGDRASLFVRPGPELVALTHGLFRAGVVPVLIDPGMGRARLLACLESIRPRALIGVPRIHVARRLFPRSFRGIERFVTVGRRLPFGGPSLEDVERAGASETDLGGEPTRSTREAAILFTSGSTGPPKGVVYTHGIFDSQLRALQALYDLQPGEVDAACFPLFALFDNALGMTSVFPPVDPTRPGRCDPAAVHRAIEESGATFTFGSPAIWRRVLAWAAPRGARFTTLRRVTVAGAPVPPSLALGLRALLPPGGDVHTPYGATEALPVSDVSASRLQGDLQERTEAGDGTCVGRPAPGIELRLIEIDDRPLVSWEHVREAAPGEPGEICVRGPVVTHEYKFDAEATRAAKIQDGAGFWHRMGDVGYADEDGLLWYLGRKAHRLDTEGGLLMPVPLENVFNVCAGVRRTALVGLGDPGRERPCLIVEADRGARRRDVLRGIERLRAERAADTDLEEVLFHPAFPVDARHNAKIHRRELKRWAEGRQR